jgi:myo-inositol-1(or 4)-monophosphatase
MSDTDLTQLLTEATDAVQAAAAALVDALAGRPLRPEFRSWAEFRTEFDELDGMSGALIRARLAPLLPDADWATELGTELPRDGDVWVLDALDGAIQYIQGLPNWSVSLALVRDGDTVLAALHNPVRAETYTGLRGGGAYLNGAAVTPSVKTDLAITLISTSQPPFVGDQPDAVTATARANSVLLPRIGVLRNLGPTSWQIADVASGRIDAFWEYGQDAANLLAGALLVGEAGGSVSDAEGNPWVPSSDSFIAGPLSLQTQLVEVLSSEQP